MNKEYELYNDKIWEDLAKIAVNSTYYSSIQKEIEEIRKNKIKKILEEEE